MFSPSSRSWAAAITGFMVSAAELPVSAAIFKNGLIDHSICCGAGGPLSLEGTAVRASGNTIAALTTVAAGPVGGGAKAESTQPAAASASATPAAAKEVDGHVLLEFAQLSDFRIDAPAFDPEVKPEAALAAVDKQIPASLKQFDGRRAQVTGFMLPVKMDGQLVSQFLLLRDQMMCCYGVVPRMNDWVVVYAAKPVRFTPDVPVSFRGKIQVKAMQEQGFVTGIYLLEEAVPAKL